MTICLQIHMMQSNSSPLWNPHETIYVSMCIIVCKLCSSGYVPEARASKAWNKSDTSFDLSVAMGKSYTAQGRKDISILTSQRITQTWFFGCGLIFIIHSWTIRFIDQSRLTSLSGFLSLLLKWQLTTSMWTGSLQVSLAFPFPRQSLLHQNPDLLPKPEPPRVTSLKATMPAAVYDLFGDESVLSADPRGFVVIVKKIGESFLGKSKSGVTIKLKKVLRRLFFHPLSFSFFCASWMAEFDAATFPFHKVVTKIKYSVKGGTVTTSHGSQYSGKHIIITVSLGVLQSNSIDFQPDLPVHDKDS